MEFFEVLGGPKARAERRIDRICDSFDMDCVDLNHDACWRGDAGIMPCCGLEVEFEKVRGICPFVWVRRSS